MEAAKDTVIVEAINQSVSGTEVGPRLKEKERMRRQPTSGFGASLQVKAEKHFTHVKPSCLHRTTNVKKTKVRTSPRTNEKITGRKIQVVSKKRGRRGNAQIHDPVAHRHLHGSEPILSAAGCAAVSLSVVVFR